ncbi:alpha-ketoglutarate-dependent dioxygenase AlkB [Nocardioides rubriscoriae]|uniref:alpha-ketoglutarate-dependent dioxygenase AlkB n=1 Tax=Nocardioides rubriscoriae TaxID=642762 RepID=UPI0011DFD6FC|nr:alpha-ketoglutarate-dependent dioxygenase AlkB [Nocardioides rubriscoriae]
MTVQPSLFDDGGLGVDTTFATARRTPLDEHSWVEHVPGWLSGSLELFEHLLGLTGWEQRERWMPQGRVAEPRLTTDVADLAAAPHPVLATAAQALSTHYGVDYDGLWMNLYRDHRDSTGWHGDAASCRRPDCTVPVLSLGAARRFLVRPVDGGPSTVLSPVSGDLVVMGGRCQTDWRHSVPKQTVATGPRISVNFRASSQARPDPR